MNTLIDFDLSNGVQLNFNTWFDCDIVKGIWSSFSRSKLLLIKNLEVMSKKYATITSKWINRWCTQFLTNTADLFCN